ncbi:MAG: hypothetical protein QM648_08935 [Solirubrobacterales bacterium]
MADEEPRDDAANEPTAARTSDREPGRSLWSQHDPGDTGEGAGQSRDADAQAGTVADRTAADAGQADDASDHNAGEADTPQDKSGAKASDAREKAAAFAASARERASNTDVKELAATTTSLIDTARPFFLAAFAVLFTVLGFFEGDSGASQWYIAGAILFVLAAGFSNELGHLLPRRSRDSDD